MVDFAHLHVHSQYSILDGASDIRKLVAKAKDDGMKALALTDHGNMFGALEFHTHATKEGIKPILGCEVYVAKRKHTERKEKIDQIRDHLILLVKNHQGYKNLIRLVSIAYLDGFYTKPRIDKELLEKYHEGLIASSACLAGEIPRAIREDNIDLARKVIQQYTDIFGEDFYLEMMRHPATGDRWDTTVFPAQQKVNEALVKLSAETGVKLIATNDVHYINAADAEAHDLLICLNTAKELNDPNRMRYTGQEWFKTRDEMEALFADHPEALINTQEIVDKVETYELENKPVMPNFILPDGFTNDQEYLRHLTYEGAKVRYKEVTEEVKARIEFELSTIEWMGYPGYFLIVSDFIDAARKMDVWVGPGRGSAAGSIVAYCLKITNVDPLQYGLLFERFLNPDRISMPDIDIDFDEDGREKVIKYVIDKYGKDKVAQVITFGTMGAKMAIRDIGRVLELHKDTVNNIAKLIPDRPGTTLAEAYEEVAQLRAARASEDPKIAETLRFAETLEGSVRQTGVHACAIIIGKEDLAEHIPLAAAGKEEQKFPISQYEGNTIEKVGMLKMDLLGLKTLSIINDSLINIKKSRGIDVDIENISLDDPETYKLFGLGKTTGVFQFESDGMKKHLKELKPNKIEDLIAMNALYRPGPMSHIPSYIARKFNREKITYDLPEMEPVLKDTYGITVYQEQVMKLSQILGGFTGGQADSLRKAMGKKDRPVLEMLRPKFLEGFKNKGHQDALAEKIWNEWVAFADYAFNKSHSTCYAYVAYRMAYLKAHYPEEFMAAVLGRNLRDIKEITLFIEECRRLGIPVLGPDVNESDLTFTVNAKGEIRFGMAGIKNVGENAAKNVVDEREKNGPFKDIFDFANRIDLRSVNKRSFEALARAGAFDAFPGVHRAQYFYQQDKDDTIFLDKIIRHAAVFQDKKKHQQQSLFGDQQDMFIQPLKMPECPEWSKLERMKMEKEIIGFYMTGHPLDEWKIEIDNFCSVTIEELKQNLDKYKNKEVIVAGMITEKLERVNKNGKKYGTFRLEDYSDSISLMMFSDDYLKLQHLLTDGNMVLIKLRIEVKIEPNERINYRIQNFFLLADVMDKFTRSVILQLDLNQVSKENIARLVQLAKSHKGRCALKILVRDDEAKVTFDTVSNKFRVQASDFIKALEESQEFNYTLEVVKP
ncbi:MAG: DNA polymerase III subunit alpha [Bacteroidetes bacterium]|nr:DNA polymerase III subunit alpha [Bacteroidota bacterium]